MRHLAHHNTISVPEVHFKVLIAAHGNSLRALVKHLDGIADDAIAELNIPTGIPLVYTLDDNMQPIRDAQAWAPLSAR